MSLSQTEVRPTRHIADRHTDVVEVGRARAAGRVQSCDSYLRQYPLTYCEKASEKAHREELVCCVKLASNDHKSGGGVENRLQPTSG